MKDRAKAGEGSRGDRTILVYTHVLERFDLESELRKLRDVLGCTGRVHCRRFGTGVTNYRVYVLFPVSHDSEIKPIYYNSHAETRARDGK